MPQSRRKSKDVVVQRRHKPKPRLKFSFRLKAADLIVKIAWVTAAILAVIIFCLLVVAEVVAASSLSFGNFALINATVFIGAGMYPVGIRLTRKKRLAALWKSTDVKLGQIWVSKRSLQRVLFVLADATPQRPREDEILLLTRRHWAYLWPAVLMVIASVALVYVSVRYGTVTYTIPGQGDIPAREANLWFWWMPLCTAAACIVAAVLRWVEWMYKDLVMITNLNFILLSVPPICFPWMDADVRRMPLARIGLVGNKDSGWGNLLGYGTLSMESNMQADEAFQNVEWTRRHTEVVDLVDGARPIHAIA